METLEAQARRAINHATPDVAALILDMARERSHAIQANSIALDARMTQACYLQFAAAAVCAALLGNVSSSLISTGAAAFAAVAYLAGAFACFRGVRSDFSHVPGLPASWWIGIADVEDFNENDAKCWAAETIEHMLIGTESENEKRALALNLSLKFAAAATVLIGVSALAKLAFT